MYIIYVYNGNKTIFLVMAVLNIIEGQDCVLNILFFLSLCYPKCNRKCFYGTFVSLSEAFKLKCKNNSKLLIETGNCIIKKQIFTTGEYKERI